MRAKKGEFGFVWIFAIFVGAAILLLAIYGAMKVGEGERYTTDTEVAKSISILTDPLQAGFSEGSYGSIEFKEETRINNVCIDSEFGSNGISVATRSNVGDEWITPGATVSIYNKYLFSSERNSGEKYYVFSKPFDFPYKVADLIFLTSEEYCFFNAPDEISEEIFGLNVPNVDVVNGSGQCKFGEGIKVCFGSGSGCDMMVYGACSSDCDSVYDEGTVEKYGVTMKYVGNLMYGAIFSDKGVYDCNVKRLLYRSAKVAEAFVSKGNLMDSRGCDTNLIPDLTVWNSMAINATSDDLMTLRQTLQSQQYVMEEMEQSMWAQILACML